MVTLIVTWLQSRLRHTISSAMGQGYIIAGRSQPSRLRDIAMARRFTDAL